MALISVIIPCYNVENFLDRCLQSVERQTIGIENLELILINDASTDDTLEIQKKWEKKYPEIITLIPCENRVRLGGARNLGIQYATSDFIGFVDADDWIEPDMYELLYEKAKTGQYDVVRGKYIRDTSYEPLQNGKDVQDRKDREFRFQKVNGYYYSDYEGYPLHGLVTCLFRRRLIMECKIPFPEIAYEDNYWQAIMDKYIGSCYFVDKVIYHYFLNPNSTTTSRDQAYQLDRLKIEMLKLGTYEEMGILHMKPFEEQIEAEFVKDFYLNTLFILFTRFRQIPDIVNYMRKTVREIFPDWAENKMLNQAVQELRPRTRILLDLLRDERDIAMEELEKIRSDFVSQSR